MGRNTQTNFCRPSVVSSGRTSSFTCFHSLSVCSLFSLLSLCSPTASTHHSANLSSSAEWGQPNNSTKKTMENINLLLPLLLGGVCRRTALLEANEDRDMLFKALLCNTLNGQKLAPRVPLNIYPRSRQHCLASYCVLKYIIICNQQLHYFLELK